MQKRVNENTVLAAAHQKIESGLQDNTCPKYSVNCECMSTSQWNTEVLEKSQTGHASARQAIYKTQTSSL